MDSNNSALPETSGTLVDLMIHATSRDPWVSELFVVAPCAEHGGPRFLVAVNGNVVMVAEDLTVELFPQETEEEAMERFMTVCDGIRRKVMIHNAAQQLQDHLVALRQHFGDATA